MKTRKLKNTMAACTGRAMLYCYRSYIFLFKETSVYKVADATPVKKHTQLTSKQFKLPCYN